jgi:beta-lactamase superfamily II metal-dependent hydrolase
MLKKTIALLAPLFFSAAALAGPADKKLDIYWIDVEGGAAALFVTPAGESVLIDTGNPAKAGGPARDATRIHKACVDAGLKRIDHLITTHYHLDHFGGAAELATMIPIGTVYDNGDLNGRERPSQAYLEFKCDKRVVLQPGDQLPVKNLDDAAAPKFSIQCIATRQKTMPAPATAKPNAVANPRRKPEDRSDNANSVVSVVQFGDWRMYTGGDVTWNTEEKLVVPVDLVGTVDVYQVTHHGLDVSNNPLVIQACKPRVAVFCNGATKGAMPEVMATVKSTDSIVGIYQMHKITRPDGPKTNVPDEFIANQTPDCQGNGIRCVVEPDGKAYSITIPATKHEQRFETQKK